MSASPNDQAEGHGFAAKTARLRPAFPELGARLREAVALLQSKRFVNFKSLNGVHVQRQAGEGELAFHVSLYLQTLPEHAFAVLRDEFCAPGFNAFLRASETLQENADFAEYRQRYQLKLGGPSFAKRFCRFHFVEDSAWYLLELPSGADAPEPNAAPSALLLSLRPHSTTRKTLLQMLVVPGQSALRDVFPELMSFYGCLALEAEVLYLRRCERVQAQLAPLLDFQDRRAGMPPEHAQAFTEWHARLLAAEPARAQFHVNDFARFFQGYGFRAAQAEPFFEKFAAYFNAHVRDRPAESFAKLHPARPMIDLGRAPSGQEVVLVRLRFLMSADDPEGTLPYLARCLTDALAAADPRVDSLVFVVDCKSYTSRNVTLDGVKKCAGLFGDLFPEALHRLLLLNMSTMMGVFFATVKMFLHEHTQRKIAATSTSTEQMRKALSEWLPVERIPAEYGGGLAEAL